MESARGAVLWVSLSRAWATMGGYNGAPECIFQQKSDKSRSQLPVTAELGSNSNKVAGAVPSVGEEAVSVTPTKVRLWTWESGHT